MTCVSDPFDLDQELARITLLDRLDERSSDRLRWNLHGRGRGLESTRDKGIHVVFRLRLDVVPEETIHGKCFQTKLVPFGDRVLTAVVLSGRGSSVVGVNDGF